MNVPGVSDDERAEDWSDSSSGSGHSDGSGTGSDELGGGVNVLLGGRGLQSSGKTNIFHILYDSMQCVWDLDHIISRLPDPNKISYTVNDWGKNCHRCDHCDQCCAGLRSQVFFPPWSRSRLREKTGAGAAPKKSWAGEAKNMQICRILALKIHRTCFVHTSKRNF